MTEPTIITIEVSGGVCHYDVADRGHPIVIRFKDHDNIEAGDPNVWSYDTHNVERFHAD